MSLVLHVIGFLHAFSYLVASDELVVMGYTKPLNLTPSIEVKGSPGLKPEVTTLCERIHIYGFQSRYYDMYKYPTSLKLILKASTSDDDIHVCLHMISSRAIGMCPHNLWKKVSNGTLIQRSSPFGHQIMDIRVRASKGLPFITVSVEEEWFMHRIAFLIIGAILLSLNKILEGRCLAFYNSMSVIAGNFLVVLFFLFQGIKRLPTRLNTSSLFLYSLLIGLSSILYRCIPDWYQSMLIRMEIDQGYEPFALGVPLFHLHFAGVHLGNFATSYFARTKDGSIDSNTFLFVSRSFWILALFFILQSSSDLFLALGALVSVIVVTRLICLLGLHEIVMNFLERNWKVIYDATEPTVTNFMRRMDERAIERMRKYNMHRCHMCRRMP